MCVLPTCMKCICALCAYSVSRSQKRALELRMIMNCHIDNRNQTWSNNCWAVSPIPAVKQHIGQLSTKSNLRSSALGISVWHTSFHVSTHIYIFSPPACLSVCCVPWYMHLSLSLGLYSNPVKPL